jgi:hypothetical protein
VTYASETWVLKGTIIQKLLVFERKILRRIFGPTKENQIWRIKTNEELDKLMKHKCIINHIIAQKLSWFGHVQRMPDTRTVKKIFNWKPLTKRSHGRPKYRWEDNITQDICQMKIKNWIPCVQDRGKWKEVIEKVITFATVLFSASVRSFFRVILRVRSPKGPRSAATVYSQKDT